jgi:glycine hydroxymethyltransferase
VSDKRRIAVASDHRGFALKGALRKRLEACGHEVTDFGCSSKVSSDYPDSVAPAALALSEGSVDGAVLVCGSGIGVAMSANRVPGVRAATALDAETAEQTRRHNDANAIALSADRLDDEEAWEIVERWLETPFEGGRHERRVAKLEAIPAGSPQGALDRVDPAIGRLVRREAKRQAFGLELIASENFVSEAVLQAVGSVLTNKYAEGYPGRRYYGGCEVVDEVEALAIERAKALFGADHANVQPHAGSQANEAVYRATLELGDTLLAMNLDHGGHLTHGSPVNFSGKLYRIVPYGVRRDTEQIDYDQVRDLAREHRPKMIQCGTTAYSRVIDFKVFREIADEVGALLFADIAHIAGLVATGHHPTPVGQAHVVTTTTHKTLRGPRGGFILCDAELQKKIDSAVFPGGQGGPLMHVIAGKAVAFHEAAQPEFRDYAGSIIENARALAGGLATRGFEIVSGGTDTHLVLLSLIERDTTGKAAQIALGRAGITANKNMVPYDPRKPMVTSGIRIGTPALTTRGMGPAEMEEIAALIGRVLERPGDVNALDAVRADVETLARRFPLYPGRFSERD